MDEERLKRLGDYLFGVIDRVAAGHGSEVDFDCLPDVLRCLTELLRTKQQEKG